MTIRPTEPPGLDALTGLRSRAGICACLDAARAGGHHGAVALLDLDHFKQVNDQLGHSVGDQVLHALAGRLHEGLPGAQHSRLGGDEFLILLPGTTALEARAILTLLLESLRAPMTIAGEIVVEIGMSVGLGTFNGQSTDELLRVLDAALYAAKLRGRGQVVMADEEIRQVVARRRELAAAVVALKKRNRLLHDEARLDALTGLWNRLALNEVLDLPTGAGAHPWRVAAAAFIDVDCFGAYNHRHGDASGDQALAAIASAIKNSVREDDRVYRKGGEEIVVLLPGMDHPSAIQAAERIRLAVERLAIPHSDSSVKPWITVTVGLASASSRSTVRQLVSSAADQAMGAKASGRRNEVHPVILDAGRNDRR